LDKEGFDVEIGKLFEKRTVSLQNIKTFYCFGINVDAVVDMNSHREIYNI
jgi:hypothetical protein